MIITVTSNKGGVCKTSVATTLAHGIALTGRTVRIADLDRNGHCAACFGLPATQGAFDYFVNHAAVESVLRPTRYDRCALLPGNNRTVSAETVLRDEQTIAGIQPRLQELASGIDVLIFDTHNGGWLQEAATVAADLVITPVLLEELALQSHEQTVKMIRSVNPTATLRMLPIRYDARVTDHAVQWNEIKTRWPAETLNCIPARNAVNDAVAAGQTIWEYKHASLKPVREAYQLFIQWIVEGSAPAPSRPPLGARSGALKEGQKNGSH